MTNYTISIFTDNALGLLNRITGVFTRRRLNIESLTVCETERPGISRYTIVIRSPEREIVEKLVRQIRKIVEVQAVFGYLDEDVVYHETALFKVATPLGHPEGPLDIRTLNADCNARVIYWGEDYVIIEKAGTEEDIADFFKYISRWGIMEFARSGRVALPRSRDGLVEYMPEPLPEVSY